MLDEKRRDGAAGLSRWFGWWCLLVAAGCSPRVSTERPTSFREPSAFARSTRALRWSTSGNAPAACGWTDMAASGPQVALRTRLAPGETHTSRLVLVSEVLDDRTLRRIARTSHADRRQSVRAAWLARLASGLRVELGDPEVEGAIMASTALLLCCRERIEGHWFPTGGPFQYHDVWLRDGCRAIAALSRAGFTRDAREMAEGFLTLQLPQGAFISQRGQLDGTGQALWAFEQALLRPQPDSGTARFARAAAQAVDWAEAQRKLG